MQTKDIVQFTLTGIAIALSVVSLLVTFWQRKVEMQRSVRSQMNTLMLELIKTLSDDGEAPPANGTGQENARRQSRGRTHKAASLTRQAVYLIEQEPSIVNDVEYITVAQGLAVGGDTALADQYWNKALDSASTDFLKIVARRGYAMFLFSIGDHEVGRKQFELALTILDNSTDRNKLQNAATYMQWLEIEAENNFYNDAYERYQRAKGLLDSTGNSGLKRSMARSLGAMLGRLRPAHGLRLGAIGPNSNASPHVGTDPRGTRVAHETADPHDSRKRDGDE